MYHYIVNYAHTYLIHAGAWGAWYGFMAIKDGKEFTLKKLLTSAFLLATFSAFTHNHYMHFLK